jgi:hypothetical protein
LFGVQENEKEEIIRKFRGSRKVKKGNNNPQRIRCSGHGIPVLPFILVCRSTFLCGIQADFSPYQTDSSFEIASLPILTGIVNYFPSECKLFVCSWYSITLHADHLKAEVVHIDRFTLD